ncbi:MAG TPA: Crp/Fnr family transcriptional regulator, partial [Alphaproteobacteria bacterium]|nr:Crp/Fnr family transcriptional regulator [Alphaproteobacteria bacterium]
LFGFFPPPIRSRFYNASETRSCKAGDVIFRRGEDGPWFAAILAGRVRECVRAPDGKQMLLSIVERGEIFGERSLLDGLPRAADAIADEDTTFLVVERDDFLPVLFQYPEAMYAVIKMLCNRMLRYTHTLEMCALESLPARLAYLLLYLADKYGTEQAGQTVIRAGLTQSDLGNFLAGSRESVNKQLKAFVGCGYIALEGEDILLIDRLGLASIAAPEIAENAG